MFGSAKTGLTWRWGAILVICAGIAALAAFALVRATRSANAQRGPSRVQGPSIVETMANPLPTKTPTQVSMGDASSAFADTGGTIVLPDTTQVTPSDVGPVWVNQLEGETKGDTAITVAVTFPKQELIILYTRPTTNDPSAYTQGAVKSEPGSQLISLNGVPAWGMPEPSDGSNWGLIQFIAGGTEVEVDGHTDVASLQAVAQSIVDRATASS